MATIKNKWLGYLDRSFEQIKASLLARVTLSNPELTDHSPSNIFVIIIEMFAAIAEMIGYYIDNIAEEAFLVVAQRRSSIIKHVKGLDYRIKARSPEQVDLTIVWDQAVPEAFTLSAGLRIDSITGIRFISLTDVLVEAGALSSVVPLSQVTEISNDAFALTTGAKNEEFSLGDSYVQGSLTLLIGGEEYTEVNTFAHSLPTDRHFIVDIKEDGNAYFIIGNGVKGVLENAGLTVDVVYRTTLGEDGKVGSGQFDEDTLVLNSVLPGTLAVGSSNSNFASAGGSDYEATEEIRSNSIASIRTQDRAVTRQDHIDILEALPSVGKAAVSFCCGKTIDLYIVPTGGGVASSGVIDEAQAEINEKKMIATFPVVKPAGETQLVIKATVTARKRKSIIETKAQVEDALVEYGSIENQGINGAVRLSDLQALIDNQANVDFVELTSLYTKPYARAVVGVNALVWTNETRLASIAVVKWRIEYDGINFRIFRDGVFMGTLAPDTAYVATDNIFTFTISDGGYAAGDTWEFNTYPFLANIELTDFTILNIDAADLAITVNAAPSAPVNVC